MMTEVPTDPAVLARIVDEVGPPDIGESPDIFDAVESLPPEQKYIIESYAYAGWPMAVIAEDLGITER